MTNQYSTFEARKLALETQHTRILELLADAVDLDTILQLEEARFEIESELNYIGQQLATYDSLIDFSTLDLRIEEATEEIIVLPRADTPVAIITEVTKSSMQLEVYNHMDEAVTIHVDLLQIGRFVREYDQDVYAECKTIFKIG